jgi:hypothetical protein
VVLPALDVAGRSFAWSEMPIPVRNANRSWWHPGLAITEDGWILLFDQGDHILIALDRTGTVMRRTHLPLRVGHGLTIDRRSGGIWVADPGLSSTVNRGVIQRVGVQGRVAQLNSDGHIVEELPIPPVASYDERPYRPTSVAIVGDGGSGSGESVLWVADGYGESLVHRVTTSGRYIDALDGTNTGQHFDCPHSLYVDPRADEPRLLVSDRANHVVRVFDSSGRERNAIQVGDGTLPSATATVGHLLLVLDLRGRILVFDEQDRPVGMIGRSSRRHTEAGWPNVAGPRGTVVQPKPRPAELNSPHSIAVASDGRVVVAEWLIGGRIVILDPLGRSG